MYLQNNIRARFEESGGNSEIKQRYRYLWYIADGLPYHLIQYFFLSSIRYLSCVLG